MKTFVIELMEQYERFSAGSSKPIQIRISLYRSKRLDCPSARSITESDKNFAFANFVISHSFDRSFPLVHVTTLPITSIPHSTVLIIFIETSWSGKAHHVTLLKTQCFNFNSPIKCSTEVNQ